jgi:hypothetical protein
MPEYDPATYEPAHRAAPGSSWPPQDERRSVGVAEPRTEERDRFPAASTGRRTFSARVTAAIAAGAFLVGAAAAILVGGLTGPAGGPGGGPGGTPPGISGTQDGGTGTGTAPSTGT